MCYHHVSFVFFGKIIHFCLETDLNASFNYLHEAQTNLQDAVRDKFDKAVKDQDKVQVER